MQCERRRPECGAKDHDDAGGQQGACVVVGATAEEEEEGDDAGGKGDWTKVNWMGRLLKEVGCVDNCRKEHYDCGGKHA